jgi:hypothetical protein
MLSPGAMRSITPASACGTWALDRLAPRAKERLTMIRSSPVSISAGDEDAVQEA